MYLDAVLTTISRTIYGLIALLSFIIISMFVAEGVHYLMREWGALHNIEHVVLRVVYNKRVSTLPIIVSHQQKLEAVEELLTKPPSRQHTPENTKNWVWYKDKTDGPDDPKYTTTCSANNINRKWHGEQIDYANVPHNFTADTELSKIRRQIVQEKKGDQAPT